MPRDKTIDAAARKLDMSPRTLRRWIVEDDAPHDRGPPPRRPYLVDVEEVAEWHRRRQARVSAAVSSARAAAREPEPVDEPTPTTETGLAPPSDGPTDRPRGPRRGERRARRRLVSRLQERVAGGVPPEAPLTPPAIPENASAAARARALLVHAPQLPGPERLLQTVELIDTLRAELRSVAIVRMPTDDDDLRLSERQDHAVIDCVPRAEAMRVGDAGGWARHVEERHGPGSYLVTFTGPLGVTLHRTEVIVPDLKGAAEKARRERDRAAEKRFAEAQARAREERAARRAAAIAGTIAKAKSWALRYALAEANARATAAQAAIHAVLREGGPHAAERVAALRATTAVPLADVEAVVRRVLDEHSEELPHMAVWEVPGLLDPHLPPAPPNHACWPEAAAAWWAWAWQWHMAHGGQ